MTDEVIDTVGHTVEEESAPESKRSVELCLHDDLDHGATDNKNRVLCKSCGAYVHPDGIEFDDTEVGSSAEFKAAEEALEQLNAGEVVAEFECENDNHDLDHGIVATNGGILCRLCGNYIGGQTPEEKKLTEKQVKANRLLELHSIIASKKNEIAAHYEEVRSLTHFESEEEAKKWLSEQGLKYEHTEKGAEVRLPNGSYHRSPSLINAASTARLTMNAAEERE